MKKFISLLLTGVAAMIMQAFAQQPMVYIVGNVTNQDGDPFDFAKISIIRTSDSELIDYNYSDWDGSFVMELPAGTRGEYSIVVTNDGYASDSRDILIEDDTTYGPYDFVLRRLVAQVNISLTDASSGAPVSNASITVTQDWETIAEVTSDTGDYSFEIPAVSKFPYEVEIEAEDYIPYSEEHYFTDGANDLAISLVSTSGIRNAAVVGMCVSSSGKALAVSNLSNPASVWSADGRLLYTSSLQDSFTISLTPGLYLVKSGADVRKIRI